MCVVPTSTAGHVAYRHLGFTIEDGGRHTIGTASTVVPLERGYLEVISIWDNDGGRRSPRRRAIADYIEREAGGLIGFGLRPETIGEDIERLSGAGLAYGDRWAALVASRRRARHLAGKCCGRLLNHAPRSCRSWSPVTGAPRRSPVTNTVTVTAISVVSDDPDQLVGSCQVLPDAEPVAEDRPDLGARERQSSNRTGSGSRCSRHRDPELRSTLARQGPGPVHLELRANDLHALADPIGLDPSPGSVLIPQTLDCGVRMLITAA